MAQPSDILSDYISPGDVYGDRYEIEREIDAGSYGAIYLATDRDGPEKVAVKALPPRGEGSSDKAIGRFERELKVVRNLEHPCIVDVVDYGETDESVLYMVMEYVEGETLDERVNRDGRLPIGKSLSVTEQIAAALSVAHASGVIHRDLKPANIMLVEEGGGYRVKILDFGMAKLFAQLGGESIAALTRDGVAVGTPRYIAPEQARGTNEIGPWTDLYALGLLLYEMVVGQKAVPYDEVDRAVAAHVDSVPLEMPGIDEFPGAIRETIRDLTAKDVEGRLDSAEALVRRIESLDRDQLIEEFDGAEQLSAASNRSVDVSNFGAPTPDGTRPIYGAVGRAPDAPEMRERPQFEELTEVADDSIELDWDRRRKGARGGRSDLWRTPPRFLAELSRPVRLGLGAASVLVASFVAFLVLTAQFHEFSGVRRAIFGVVPLGIAIASVLGSRPVLRGWHFCRNAAVFNGLGFVIAHVLGPHRLIRGLSSEPAWFLDFLDTNPVGYVVVRTVAALGYTYADVLSWLFGAVPAG